MLNKKERHELEFDDVMNFMFLVFSFNSSNLFKYMKKLKLKDNLFQITFLLDLKFHDYGFLYSFS